MGVKVYISGISGNKEVKKHQQRVMMILDSKNVAYEVIDITEPGKEDEKEFMQSMSTARDSKHPLPPQIFNDEDYCGDYEDFDLANEIDELEKFLKLISINDDSVGETLDESHSNIRQNGNASSREASTDKDVSIAHSESEVNERQQSTVDESNEKSKSVDDDEDDLSVKSQIEDGEQMDESTDKNEEKSDDQEKEE